MLGTAKLIAFVASSKPAKAKAFYMDTLGLRLISDEASALVFDANGTQLRIQKVQEVNPPAFTVLGWEVGNIKEALDELEGRGVSIERFEVMEQDPYGIWTADDGTCVAWFRDPDGNLLSITEFP